MVRHPLFLCAGVRKEIFRLTPNAPRAAKRKRKFSFRFKTGVRKEIFRLSPNAPRAAKRKRKFSFRFISRGTAGFKKKFT
jgi:hypothetical protein